MAYSESFIAEALAALDANSGNVNGTSRQIGVSEPTLRKWKNERAKNGGRQQGIEEKYEGKKVDLGDRLEAIADMLAGELAKPEKAAAASMSQVATALGITIDKMRLLRGESTDIQEVRDVDGARKRLLDRLTRHSSLGATTGAA